MTWTYLNSGGTYPFTVTETDPANNYTVYSMWGEYPGTIKYYEGANTGTPMKTVSFCYWNGTLGNCASSSQAIYSPFTEVDKKVSLGTSASNNSKITLDSHGNVTGVYAYDFGASIPTRQTITAYGTWNGTSCVAISGQAVSPYIVGTPCDVKVEDGPGNILQETRTSYDAYGRATDRYDFVSGTTFLHSSSTYNPNGTIATSTDVGGNVSTYAYNGTNGCNGLLPTSITKGGLTTTAQWNCNGGVVTQTTDPNGRPTTYTYNDPSWRARRLLTP